MYLLLNQLINYSRVDGEWIIVKLDMKWIVFTMTVINYVQELGVETFLATIEWIVFLFIVTLNN